MNEKDDPLKLLEILEEESSRAWMKWVGNMHKEDTVAKLKKLPGKILCMIGLHKKRIMR